ncbi:MAG: hypothetical protein IJR59_06640 [Firmicutes bacterium]|nr:hypothetical protein [Bacillota bacterium]
MKEEKIKIAVRILLAINHIFMFPFVLLFLINAGYNILGSLYILTAFMCAPGFILFNAYKIVLFVYVTFTLAAVGRYLKNACENDNRDKKMIIRIIIYFIELISFFYWNTTGFLPT